MPKNCNNYAANVGCRCTKDFSPDDQAQGTSLFVIQWTSDYFFHCRSVVNMMTVAMYLFRTITLHIFYSNTMKTASKNTRVRKTWTIMKRALIWTLNGKFLRHHMVNDHAMIWGGVGGDDNRLAAKEPFFSFLRSARYWHPQNSVCGQKAQPQWPCPDTDFFAASTRGHQTKWFYFVSEVSCAIRL